jgi:hypothetical protein
MLSIEAEIKKISDILSIDFNDLGAKDTLSSLETERNEILRKEEQHWQMRSRALWMAGGDRNTKFFHKIASQNRVKKHIWEIEKEDGALVKDQLGIKNEVVHYLSSFYRASSTVNIEEQCKLIDLFPLMVTEEEVNTLYNPVTLEELKLTFYFSVKKKKVWVQTDGQQSFSSIFFIL